MGILHSLIIKCKGAVGDARGLLSPGKQGVFVCGCVFELRFRLQIKNKMLS